jgi:AcrR family transcriptional regulator
MRSDSSSAVQSGYRTFIEQARRAQIVGVAIDTIAELGYAQASLARIAERAGISKGVIAYHFAGKEDLIAAVVSEVLTRAEHFMGPRISQQSGGRAVLREYIESNLAFMGAFRNHLVAVVEIARGTRRPDGSAGFDRSAMDAGAVGLAKLLTRFQAAGELRADFDPQVMAMAIRAAIDAVPPRLALDPELDVEHCGRELADLFDYATRDSAKPRRKSGR